MDCLREKEIAALWKSIELRGQTWQQSLQLGCKVVPLYELKTYWNILASLEKQPRYQLAKQALEADNARLKTEIAFLREALQHKKKHSHMQVVAPLIQMKAANSN